MPQSPFLPCPSTRRKRLSVKAPTVYLLTIPQLDIHTTPNFKGYTALLSANANPDSKGDLHEGFDIGWEPDSAAGGSEIIADGPMSGTNVWPENLPGFQEDVLEY